jgi:hypothetical protein
MFSGRNASKAGSDTGEEMEDEGEIDIWMGTWAPHVTHHDSNWKELRTLMWMIEQLVKKKYSRVRGGTLFYFTDNYLAYYIIKGGSLKNVELHRLARDIKHLEIQLGCHLQLVHFPGVLMIDEGTYGLSQGMCLVPAHLT